MYLSNYHFPLGIGLFVRLFQRWQTSPIRRLLVNGRRRWDWRTFLSFWAWKRGYLKPKFDWYSKEHFLHKMSDTLKPFETESWWKNSRWFPPTRGRKKTFLFDMTHGLQSVVSFGWFYIIIKTNSIFFLIAMINLRQIGYQTVQSVRIAVIIRSMTQQHATRGDQSEQ